MVLCTGGESCGTRLACWLVGQLGAEPFHQSYPHGWKSRQRVWPDYAELHENYRFTAAVVIVRDWHCAALSQARRGHVRSLDAAYDHLRRAAVGVPAAVAALDIPWLQLDYELVVAEPDHAAAQVAALLGVDPIPLDKGAVYDGNRKWLLTPVRRTV